MPVPTDTFWNIRRLNLLFAISAVVLMLVTVWTIMQDWNRAWKQPQREGKVWEAALVKEKITQATAGDYDAEQKKLEKEIADGTAEVQQRNERFKALQAVIRQKDSERATLEFGLNNQKALVTVDESHLQDAITAGNTEERDKLLKKLEIPRQQVNKGIEDLASLSAEIKAARTELAELNKTIDAKKRDLAKKTGDVELLKKKSASLQPQSLIGKLSATVRDAPLMGFINPPEKPNQIVLPDVRTDVAFMKITTVDRCIACHVNIADKRFTKENVLGYLEQQVAVAKSLKLPTIAGGKAPDPVATADKPGAVAMPEFWHSYATVLAPEVVKKNNTRIAAVARLAGTDKPARVTYNGQVLAEFKYDLAATEPQLVAQQNEILLGLIEAVSKWQKNDVSVTRGKAVVEIAAGADERLLTTTRTSGMRYIEELRSGMRTSLPKEAFDQVEDRYRHELVGFINPVRSKQGLPKLDPSPVMLAHSNLDLYAGTDSKHPLESGEKAIGVGCTSCHDGSGQETDFVLTAHSAREIWVDQKTGIPVLPAQLKHASTSHEEGPTKLTSMLEAVYPEDAVVPTKLDNIHLVSNEKPSTQPASEGEPNEASGAAVDYVDPMTGQPGKALTQFAYWRKTYEPLAPRDFELVYHEWDTPMRPTKYLQASCVRCHTDAYDIKEHAPVINHGRELFAGLGCVNCHQMDSIPAYEKRKVGTDLRHVTAKLSPAMINTWIWAPKAFRPTTKMPHFFMLENNSSDEEIRRTKQEARALTEYLVRTASPQKPQFVIDASLKGSADNGKKLFNAIGCLACHANLNDTTTEKRKAADGTDKVVTVGEKWITGDLPKQDEFIAELTQKLGKAPAAADLKKAAIEEYDAMSYNERQAYVQRHLEVDPGRHEAPKYADGTAKPQFVHVGPELSGIGTKLTAGRTPEQARQWLYDWLKDPRHHSDYTIMPSLRLTDQQALDLVEYLLGQKRNNDDPKDTWEAHEVSPDTGKLIEMTAFFLRSRYSPSTAVKKADDADELTAMAAEALTTREVPSEQARALAAALSPDEKRLVFLGKKLISHYGCMSCHAINGTEDIASPCANLSDWGQKAVSKLDYGYLTDHQYQEFVSAAEARGSHEAPVVKIPMVNGLSSETTHLLASGDGVSTAQAKSVDAEWFEVEHTRTDWIEHKLKNTRVYDRGRVLLEPDPAAGKDAKGVLASPGKPYDKIKMPTFYLNDEQVNAIITFVISNRDRLISDRLTARATNPQAKEIARGRELTVRYNCVSCHIIERNSPQIRQYFNPDDFNTKAPPSIRGEGNKIQHAWLFNFFKNVEPLRPLLNGGVRMPSFHATDDEFSAIITYFASVSNKESKQLREQLDPIVKFIANERQIAVKADPNAMADPAKPWPGDDWYLHPAFEHTAAMLKDWSLDIGQMRDIQFDTTRNTKEEMGKNWRTLLFKASFISELFDTPFPFVDSPRPQLTDARFKQGEQLFYEMQCLKCHVLGDSSVPGAQKAPTAPNLGLAYQRLQRRWVRHWVQEPNMIQVNTAMPPFLTGLPIFDLRGQPWPKSQGATPAEVDRVQGIYGSTPDEQANLVLDFLYAAGVRNYTGIQPVAAPAETPKPATASTTRPTTAP